MLSTSEIYFLSDYAHLAFLSGLLYSYAYYRYRHISLGGTLAIGYLAAAAYSPVNILVTVWGYPRFVDTEIIKIQ